MADPPPTPRQVRVSVARLAKWIDGFADRHGAFTAELADERVLLSAADESRAWIEIPFPPLDVEAGRLLTSLLAHVNRRRWVGVLLVRRGGHAAGVFHGRDLVASKVGSSYVQGTTKAGGWSQQRYARRRSNQARAAFAEAADVAARILLPVRGAPELVVPELVVPELVVPEQGVPKHGELELLVLGGDRAACGAVLADPRLSGLAGLPRGPFLAVADPRLRVLQASVDQFLTVQITLLP
jgi:hypothetical protein